MSVAERNIQLARTLPARLQRFFALNPPRSLATAPSHTSTIPEETTAESTDGRTEKLNPFLAHKNPATGRWHPPIYSLRRQAELAKLAKSYGVEDLLPYTSKSTEERRKRRDEHGLRMQGTGVGKNVKGHIWERALKGKLEKRRQAMLEMPKMIQEWKQVWVLHQFPCRSIVNIIEAWSWSRLEEVAQMRSPLIL